MIGWGGRGGFKSFFVFCYFYFYCILGFEIALLLRANTGGVAFYLERK